MDDNIIKNNKEEILTNNKTYACPDCKKTILFGDKFCKNCGCKIDWSEDKESEEKIISNDTEKENINIKNNITKSENIFKTPLLLVILQLIAYICGLLTKNFSFNISSGSDIAEFAGYNIFVIIAIILLIKRRRRLKEFFNYTINVILLIISFVLLTGTILIDYFDINIIDKNQKDIEIYENSVQESESRDNLSEEEFKNLKELYESRAVEIWYSGDENDIIFDEIIVTDTVSYRFMKLGLNDPIYSCYEINFIKNGDDVNISYIFSDSNIKFDGKIISNRLELYMEDGHTIYADYIKK